MSVAAVSANNSVIKPESVDSSENILVDHLVSNGYITEEQRIAAQYERSTTTAPIIDILIEKRFLRESELLEIMRDLDSNHLIRRSAYTFELPKDHVEQYSIVIHAIYSNNIIVSCRSLNTNLVERLISFYYPNRKITFISWNSQTYTDFLDKIETPQKKPDISDFYKGNDVKSIVSSVKDDAFVLDMLVTQATLMGASDIHIEPGAKTYNVYFRHNGDRMMVHTGTDDQYRVVIAKLKDRSAMDTMEKRKPLDGSFSHVIMGRSVDFRVSTIPTAGKEKAVIRVLDPENAMRDIEDLGISEVQLLKDVTSYPNGLFLISGVTGSGKTTTISSVLRLYNSQKKSIQTAEDPIEYDFPYITQTEKNVLLGVTYDVLLKAAMRQDPDIIMLSEIRDYESASAALAASETGHFVMSTVHAANPNQTIDRMIGLCKDDDKDAFLSTFRTQLRGVLSQRLLKIVCPYCHGRGCKSCVETGYAGRTVISEMAHFSNVEEFDRAHSGERWWNNMLEDALSKYMQGITDEKAIIDCFRQELNTWEVAEEYQSALNHVKAVREGLYEPRNKTFHINRNERVELMVKNLELLPQELERINYQSDGALLFTGDE